jgi:hypothetical protein
LAILGNFGRFWQIKVFRAILAHLATLAKLGIFCNLRLFWQIWQFLVNLRIWLKF